MRHWVAAVALGCALAGCADGEPLEAGPDVPAPELRSAVEAAVAAAKAGPCERRPPSLEVCAEPSGAVPAGTPVTYTLAIANRDTGSCEPDTFSSSVSPSLVGLK